MSSNNSGQLEFWLFMGFGGGLVTFFKGFRVYREYRVVEDTPEITIRSIPMGLVHIHGKAVGDERVTSPITNTPCYFYKVDIEKWKTKDESGRWEHECTDQDGVKFYLEDNSGKVLVHLRGAEYDLEQSGNFLSFTMPNAWGRSNSRSGIRRHVHPYPSSPSAGRGNHRHRPQPITRTDC